MLHSFQYVSLLVHLQTNGPFSIGATSGVIHLTNTLNFDATSMYTITVRAQVSDHYSAC